MRVIRPCFPDFLQEYQEAVQKGKLCNDWSKVVSQEVDMIVQNVSLAHGTMVAQRLDNLSELVFNAWSVDEPNADIGNLVFKCNGIEALVSALRAFSDNFQIQLLGYEILTMLVLEVRNDNAAAVSGSEYSESIARGGSMPRPQQHCHSQEAGSAAEGCGLLPRQDADALFRPRHLQIETLQGSQGGHDGALRRTGHRGPDGQRQGPLGGRRARCDPHLPRRDRPRLQLACFEQLHFAACLGKQCGKGMVHILIAGGIGAPVCFARHPRHRWQRCGLALRPLQPRPYGWDEQALH
jgi:hypothetical protein